MYVFSITVKSQFLKMPYVVDADFECSLTEQQTKCILHTHGPSYVALFIVCTYDARKHRLMYHVGKDCVSTCLIGLNSLVEQCTEEMKSHQQIQMSVEDNKNICNLSCCYRC